MKVKEIMSTEPETISPDDNVKKAAKKMNKFHIGSLIVASTSYDVIGIITERDILKAFVNDKKPGSKVNEIMTKGVITVEENATLEVAANKMIKFGVKHLVVTKKGRCTGIVTATDLITYESRLTDKMMNLMQVPRKLIEGG